MKRVIRIGLYVIAALVLPLGVGIIGFFNSMEIAMGQTPPAVPANLSLPTELPAYDPLKPTVVILLGNDLTEATDFLGPYELFRAAGAFNVYGLAPTRHLTTLTGGLEVFPDLSYADYAGLVKQEPDVIVTPNIPTISSAENQPVVDWLQKHNGPHTQLLSWCTGAGVLAQAGLLNGKAATAHWGDLAQLQHDYPQVRWQGGLRYVDEGNNIISSGGLSSGIDATLHLLSRLVGPEKAKAIANSLHYPSYRFVDAPVIPQYSFQPGDAMYGFNAAFKWEKKDYGLLLYDGIGELELVAVLDTYPASFTTRLLTVAPTRQFITSQSGLKLLPRWELNAAPGMERLLVPGVKARQATGETVTSWANQKAIPLVYLHADAPERFILDQPLEDLARQQDNPTAEFAKKRLEYRAETTHFDGAGWPVFILVRPLLLALAGLGLAFGLDRLVFTRKKRG